MASRASSILLLFLILDKSLAWDGCNFQAWRCGDTCIHGGGHVLGGRRTECKCGNTTFNNRDEMWCCNNASCSGRGEFETSDNANFWRGEEDKEGRMIGAECSGTALKLEQSCNGTCNDHEQDPGRNWEGVLRSFVPCNVNNLKTTQCIREDKYSDGDVDCRNRADEEIFQTEKGIFSREHRHICKSPFLNITRGIESGNFFPMRAIRCISLIIINSSSS